MTTHPDGRIELVDAEVHYSSGFLRPDRADRLLAELRAELDWQQREIKLFGRKVKSPRLTAFHGEPGSVYTYSNLRLEPQPWTPALDEIRTELADVSGHVFDCVLANLYRDGSDSMGWHSDDERELGIEPIIASVSLGAARRFALHHRRRKDQRVAIDLEHGSLLIMAGQTQHHWKHALPKTRRAVGERVNLTFRRIVG